MELAAAPLTVTAQRRKVVHFSVPFQQFGPAIVLKRPSSTTLTFRERVTHVFSPLAYTVWLMALLAYLVTSVVLYVICHCNPYEWRHLCLDRQATHREAESFTCMNTFWFVLSTWMWQGSTLGPTASLASWLRRPPRERKIRGLNPACDGIFLGSSHTGDLKIGTPVATLPGAWRDRVSIGTGRPGVSILWLGEVESLICDFHFSVAARKLVWADPSLRYTGMLLGR